MADRRRRTGATDWPDGFDPAAMSADPDDAIWVRRALGQLDETDREVLMLREYEQLTYQEIAALQQLPLNTVRSRLFRARVAMRDALMSRAKDGSR